MRNLQKSPRSSGRAAAWNTATQEENLAWDQTTGFSGFSRRSQILKVPIQLSVTDGSFPPNPRRKETLAWIQKTLPADLGTPPVPDPV